MTQLDRKHTKKCEDWGGWSISIYHQNSGCRCWCHKMKTRVKVHKHKRRQAIEMRKKKPTTTQGIYDEMMKTSKSFRESTPRTRETRVKRIYTIRNKKKSSRRR
ncbi:MAG: hypothetical protein AABY22_26600 [Nanoarchaeota archaeon]